ncbi:ATP-binding protein [Streptomyces europaeiscabiei]|uniref:ATP-binding protein n=1 Tax=Streptomyces europaeiscabiei TaxID=146819 RepID=UPI0029AE068B|nr:ATP-binding protein [Streptomyces europaeiscabiei]MDX2765877.1 ATP-binding protein [Streptomyces europaeiscabiei]
MTNADPGVIPVVLSGRALLSLRESGHNFPSAVGEVIDNSLESAANNIEILTETELQNRKKVLRRIVFVDDGSGMDDDTLQHYLQLGFSSRYMSDKTIGKFGVGAKLAGLSVGTRIDAWSRVAGSDAIRHVSFDLDEALQAEKNGGIAGIAPPDDEPLPIDLEPYFPAGSGTVVMWSKIDRVTDSDGRSTPDHVIVELKKELARIFRSFLSGGIRISVDGMPLKPHDPTFRRKGTWAEQVLTEHLKAAGKKVGDLRGQVFHDKMVKVEGTTHKVRVVITLAPPEVVRVKGAGGDSLAIKLRIPENEGAISFMRLDREINYNLVAKLFPKGVSTKDRYIGFEVHFTPELDRMMGVRNVKRGAVPSDGLRRTLKTIADNVIPGIRDEIDRIWGQADRDAAENSGEHNSLAHAIKDADRTMPKARAKPSLTKAQVTKEYDNLAKDAGRDKNEEEKAAYVQEIKDLPFVIETVDVPGDDLFQLTHLEGQTLIRLNERHAFYQELYEPLKLLSKEQDSSSQAPATAHRAMQAITLLLVAYAKAESMHETPVDQYKELRKWWGTFTDQYLTKIDHVL